MFQPLEKIKKTFNQAMWNCLLNQDLHHRLCQWQLPVKKKSQRPMRFLITSLQFQKKMKMLICKKFQFQNNRNKIDSFLANQNLKHHIH